MFLWNRWSDANNEVSWHKDEAQFEVKIINDVKNIPLKVEVLHEKSTEVKVHKLVSKI